MSRLHGSGPVSPTVNQSRFAGKAMMILYVRAGADVDRTIDFARETCWSLNCDIFCSLLVSG